MERLQHSHPTRETGAAVFINASDGFVTGNHNFLLDSVLAQVFPEIPALSQDYALAWFQLASLLFLIIGISLWIVLFFCKPRAEHREGIRFYARLLLPSLGLILFGLFVGLWLPHLFGIPVSGIIMFSPDIGWALFTASGLALV